jgi:hypothetical protein
LLTEIMISVTNVMPHTLRLERRSKVIPKYADALKDWLATGVPVILDVSNGNDGRIIGAHNAGGVGFWGYNLDYTDRWRNWQSELKGMSVNGNTLKGIAINCWNGSRRLLHRAIR